MKLIRTLVMSLGLAAAALSVGQPLNYANKTVKINAGVLLLSSQQITAGFPYNPSPHVWGNLDADTQVKPASWVFDNPLGQSTLTAASRNRWVNNPNAGLVPPVGSRLSKKDAAYWEVMLDESTDEVLSRFDILYLPIRLDWALNSREREKLRRYIDQGGIIWLDLQTNPVVPVNVTNSLPLPFAVAQNAAPVEVSMTHPLITTPNSISIRELGMLANSGVPNVTVPGPYGFGALLPVLGTIDRDSLRYEIVAGNTAGGVISVGRIGDGFLVVTTREMARKLGLGYDPNVPSTINFNEAFRALNPLTDAVAVAAAKLAINVVSLGSTYSQSGSGSRKSNSTKVAVEAPLLRRFTAPSPAGFTDRNSPVIFRNRVIVNSGGTLAVFDSNPSRDLDRDGNPDDGVQGATGAPFDIIWQANIGNAAAPIAVNVPDTVLANVNQVWTVNAAGNVLVFDLDTGAQLANIARPTNFQADPNGPFSVTIQDGTAYVVDAGTDNFGRIWAIDVATATLLESGGNPWIIRSSARMLRPTAAPTIGYIPIRDNSGGLDRVAYIATGPDALSNRAAGMTSVWIGAKGESPVEVTRVGNNIDLQLRSSLQNLPVALNILGSSALRVTMLLPNGDPFSLADLNNTLTGTVAQPTNGVVRVTLGGTAPAWDYDGTATPGNTADDIGWRVDYTLDWGATGSGIPGDSFIRGNVEFPDTSALTRRVIGSPALAPDGNIGVVTSHDAGVSPGGTFFNLREDGRGDFLMKSRFDLHDNITSFPLTGGGTATYREALVDGDDINVVIPFLNQRISNWRFVGAPAVLGNTMYCLATGTKSIFGFNVPTSALLAFKANPEPLEFFMATGTGDNNITLVQPDMARSLSQASPTVFSALAAGQYTIEPVLDSAQVPTGVSRITINSLMPMRRGAINSCLSTNLPIVVKRAGQSDMLIEPEAAVTNGAFVAGNAAGRWNQLLWYTILNGYEGATAPVVTGDTIYLAGTSMLPSLITSGNPFGSNGLMFAYNSSINSNDPFLRSSSVRSFQNQLIMIRKTTAAPFTLNDAQFADAMKWPQFRGVEDADDFVIRLLQAAVEDPNTLSLAAGDGSLAVTGPTSLYGFSRSDFLIADEGRVSRFDPSGNPIWSTNQTINFGNDIQSTSAGKIKNLSNPTKIYPAANNGFWIVDTGNDSVVKVDSAGRELRTIHDIRIHPSLTPNGATENESLKLRAPRDIVTYTSTKTAAQVAALFPGEVLREAATGEYWEHTMIADGGNHRAIEVVDRYRVDNLGRIVGVVQYQNEAGQWEPGLGIMYWHSPEEFSGKKYGYNSVTRVFIGTPPRSVYAFGFGNVEPGRVTFGLDSTGQDTDSNTGFGGVILYDGNQTKVITEFEVPPINANTYLGEFPAGSGNYAFNLPTNPRPATIQRMAGLNSVTLKYAGTDLTVMVTTAGGVYELYESSPGVWSVRWMLPREAYVGMRRPRTAGPFTATQLNNNPSSLRPMFARRLDSGEVLVVNGYYGTKIGGSAFEGEVFLVDGSFGDPTFSIGRPGYHIGRPNLGFTALSVKFELPPVQGIRGIIKPVFAERQ